MALCTEIYVYEIATDRVEEFLTIKDTLISEARSLPGLIESATFRSDEQENLFIDRMTWDTADAAREGLKLFASLPTSGQFMSMMAGPPKVGGHFTLIAGE
jgi:heme-degrading monooxygenase HmoA